MIKDIICPHGAMPELETRDIFFDSLPKALENKTLLFATDFHYGGLLTAKRMRRITDKITSLKPDIIMLGGDYADDIKNETEFVQDHLINLKAPLGVYCVAGNNDWETVTGEYERLRPMYKKAGAVFLVNEYTSRDLGGAKLTVTGVDDSKCGSPDKRCLMREYDPRDFNVLLCHTPAVLDDMLAGLDARFQLVLCGHTHGGQFRIGRLSPYTIGFESKRGDKRRYFFVNGEHDVDGMKIIVSNGIGCSIIPLRIGAPPMIHIFTLKVRT